MNLSEFSQKAQLVPLQTLDFPVFQKAGVEVIVRRDDLFDSELSGNKFYKLWFNLEAARCKGFRRILTFGGAYSNHIHASAAAGKRFEFETIGLIRGEESLPLNPCLTDAVAWGMQLQYLSREDYGQRNNPEFQAWLANEFDAFVIPEGGANIEGAKGMQIAGEVLSKQLNDDFTSVCVACGTGTSLAGVAVGVKENQSVYGFSALKGEGDLAQNVRRLCQALKAESHSLSQQVLPENWRLITGFHAGGYAKRLPDFVERFWQEFEWKTGILLDPVYTLKMFWGVFYLVQQGFWKRGSRIVVIHSGGLQGRRGFK
ncbi:MAG: pyridoxal-phosphate dependent enzyme [Cellvibrio sp.]|nr:pyridoxal-phosphate dependent enzyme [Cellvibrio sp.]